MSSGSDLEELIIRAIRRIVRAVDLQSRHLAGRCGLTGPQLIALRAVERLGPVSVSILAREISVGQATISGILDRLERRGLVERARDTRDRRKVTVLMTDAGRGILATAPPLLQDRFLHELTRLEEWERTSMLAALQRVASMMDAEEIDAAPLLVAGSEADMEREAPRPSGAEGPSVENLPADEPDEPDPAST